MAVVERSTPATNLAIPYTEPGTVPSKHGLYKAALCFAVAPLIVCTVCLTLYAITRSYWLTLISALNVGATLFAVFISLLCMVTYVLDSKTGRAVAGDVLRSQIWKVALLLVANLPAAAMSLGLGVRVITHAPILVRVHNHSGAAIANVRLTGSENLAFGSIAGNGSASHSVDYRDGWNLTLSWQRDGKDFSQKLRGWISISKGHNMKLDLHIEADERVMEHHD